MSELYGVTEIWQITLKRCKPLGQLVREPFLHSLNATRSSSNLLSPCESTVCLLKQRKSETIYVTIKSSLYAVVVWYTWKHHPHHSQSGVEATIIVWPLRQQVAPSFDGRWEGKRGQPKCCQTHSLGVAQWWLLWSFLLEANRYTSFHWEAPGKHATMLRLAMGAVVCAQNWYSWSSWWETIFIDRAGNVLDTNANLETVYFIVFIQIYLQFISRTLIWFREMYRLATSFVFVCNWESYVCYNAHTKRLYRDRPNQIFLILLASEETRSFKTTSPC